MNRKSARAIALLIAVCMLSGCSSDTSSSSDDAADTETESVEETYSVSGEVAAYNEVVQAIKLANEELQNAIDTAQDSLNKGETPYDEETETTLESAISEASDAMVDTPSEISDESELEDSVLPDVPDYSDLIAALETALEDYENSIQSMKQVTAPDTDFVMERLQWVDTIQEIEAVTEDNDPNGLLNKQGGYIGCVYFSDSQVDWDSLYISDGEDDVISVGTDGGGCIEIYSSVEDAESRDTYLGAFDGTAFSSGSHYIVGTVLIRTSNELTGTQQLNLTDAITEALIAVGDIAETIEESSQEDMEEDASEPEGEVVSIRGISFVLPSYYVEELHTRKRVWFESDLSAIWLFFPEEDITNTADCADELMDKLWPDPEYISEEDGETDDYSYLLRVYSAQGTTDELQLEMALVTNPVTQETYGIGLVTYVGSDSDIEDYHYILDHLTFGANEEEVSEENAELTTISCGGLSMDIPAYFSEETMDEDMVFYSTDIGTAGIGIAYSDASDEETSAMQVAKMEIALMPSAIYTAEIISEEEMTIQTDAGEMLVTIQKLTDSWDYDYCTAVAYDSSGSRTYVLGVYALSDCMDDVPLEDFIKSLQSVRFDDSATSEDSSAQDIASDDGIRDEIKEAIDSYEEFMDEYVEFMEKYMDADDSTGMLSDYLDYMEKYVEVTEQFDAIEGEELTDEELAYYAEVSLRVAQKLLAISY